MYIIMKGGRIDLVSEQEKAMLYELFDATWKKELELTGNAALRIHDHIMAAATRAANKKSQSSEQTEPPADPSGQSQLSPPETPTVKPKSRRRKPS
jgi:hypothetical protein